MTLLSNTGTLHLTNLSEGIEILINQSTPDDKVVSLILGRIAFGAIWAPSRIEAHLIHNNLIQDRLRRN